MNELINLGNGAMVKVTMLKGEAGSSISSIAKTSTEGLVDTYTITLTDGSKQTFTVTNGSNIASIQKTGTSGLVDTYTVTLTDGSTSTFTVANGRSITNIAKTGTQGLTDTYTITFNDNTTTTFTVENGGDTEEIWDVLNEMGAKNLIPFPYSDGDAGVSIVNNGITYTVNADGSITANGTASALSRFAVKAGILNNIKNGEKVVLSGCPSGGGNNIYALYTQTVNNYDYGNGVTFDWASNISGIAIVIWAGVTVNNLVFKPMIRLETFTDDTFEIYSKSNKELTKDVKNINDEISGINDEITNIKSQYQKKLSTSRFFVTIPNIASNSNVDVDEPLSGHLPDGAVPIGIIGYDLESSTVDGFRLNMYRSKIYTLNDVLTYGCSIGNTASLTAEITLQIVVLYYIS